MAGMTEEAMKMVFEKFEKTMESLDAFKKATDKLKEGGLEEEHAEAESTEEACDDLDPDEIMEEGMRRLAADYAHAKMREIHKRLNPVIGTMKKDEIPFVIAFLETTTEQLRAKFEIEGRVADNLKKVIKAEIVER